VAVSHTTQNVLARYWPVLKDQIARNVKGIAKIIATKFERGSKIIIMLSKLFKMFFKQVSFYFLNNNIK